jgi:hypothetical protein
VYGARPDQCHEEDWFRTPDGEVRLVAEKIFDIVGDGLVLVIENT